MKFQTKIFTTYSLMIFLLVLILTLLGHRYLVNQSREEMIKAMEITAEKNVQQLEDIIRPMQFISDYLLSDINVLDAMSTMAVIKPDSKQSLEYEETAKQIIRHALYTYCILENFYRISYFNDDKDFVTSNFQERPKPMDAITYSVLPWIDAARLLRGKAVVGGAYADPWSDSKEPVMVFALGRAMPGIGYLEVQHKIETLEEVFAFENTTYLKTIAFDMNNTLLYSGVEENQIPSYQSLAATLSHYNPHFIHHDKHTNTVVIGRYSDSTGIRTLLIQDLTNLSGSLKWVVALTLLIALSILLLSIVFIFFFARKLTKPIRILKDQIERTTLSTLSDEIEVDTSNNEIEAVSNAYAVLLKQLDEAILHQKNLAILNLQAQLNSLQAQINPHFLNNVLNVLSYRGLQNNDEEICNMCDSLASLLQYSTDTMTHVATIAEEIENFSHYQYLMKVRYRDSICFETSIPKQLDEVVVPRFLVQPIVENSIKHGFSDNPQQMLIKVVGSIDTERWQITIEDNGRGFDEQRLRMLQQEMVEVADKLFVHHKNIEFTSGGIGIINTYARLLLFAGNRQSIVFEIANRDTGGAAISFGLELKKEPQYE